LTSPTLLSTLSPYTTLFRSPTDVSGGEVTGRGRIEIVDVDTQHRAQGRARVLAVAVLSVLVIGATAISKPKVEIAVGPERDEPADRKSTRLNSSHVKISYAV